MTSHEKKRMADLERRVKELEARPVWPTVILQPYVPPAMPLYQPNVYPWPQPTIIWGSSQTVEPFMAPGTFTCGTVS